MDRNIYLIGPGGVGKTSSGPKLAELLGREFVDLDEKFMSGRGHIGQYISEHGYAKYVRANSQLFFEHIDQSAKPLVAALSSGFIVSET